MGCTAGGAPTIRLSCFTNGRDMRPLAGPVARMACSRCQLLLTSPVPCMRTTTLPVLLSLSIYSMASGMPYPTITQHLPYTLHPLLVHADHDLADALAAQHVLYGVRHGAQASELLRVDPRLQLALRMQRKHALPSGRHTVLARLRTLYV